MGTRAAVVKKQNTVSKGGNVTGDMVQYTLARNINQLCKDRHISKSQLANTTGLSLNSIMSIVAMKRWPRPVTLAIIAEGLGVNVQDLFAQR